MTREQIEALCKEGFAMDAIYRIAAGKMGLFHVAFFGHRGTHAQAAKLRRTWSRIVNVYHQGL